MTLPESFGIVRGELNEVWAELSDLHQLTPPPDLGTSSSPAYFQERRQNPDPGGGYAHPITCLFPTPYEAGS